MFGIWFLGYGLLDPFGMATVLFFGRVVVGSKWNGCVCGEVGDSIECLNGSNLVVVLWNAAVMVVMVEKTVTLLGSSENASVSVFVECSCFYSYKMIIKKCTHTMFE